MNILRVFNNNVVLARADDGTEVILTGRGLGFQTRPGDPVDPAKVVRTFRPVDDHDPDRMAAQLAGLPPETVQVVGQALADAGLDRLAANAAVVVAMADHVAAALARAAAGQHLEYPLLAEVQHLYAQEYAQGQDLVASINAQVDVPLPASEAVGLTLHLVNAGFSAGDLSYSYTMTGLIQQFLDVIAQQFDRPLDAGSVNVGRFVTHLRYLFVRIHQRRQLADQRHSAVGAAIRESYPDAARCADLLGSLVELRLGATLTEDELSYLALHVARVTTDPVP
ncbi:PRD domain-containing protein [Cellulomonas sp. SLBN-39]|uniref:PRD domain-containing protein n=1 Tax=Cellulomonas sp. SLBN-39 TaxID=2768446 RepID=UPI00115294FB|nr:PRD domain-containing protein [Cellulomonas sp. SLBN-39]TQL03135.1 BglG family transcriptional antiterminator [Cellulomonas sp. SLBN-39]